MGVVLAALPLPPQGDAIATQFAGIVAGIEVNRAFIPSHVINTMRNELTLASTWKIMIQRFDRGLCMGMPIPLYITLNLFRSANAHGEVHDALQALPESFHTGLTVAFAP